MWLPSSGALSPLGVQVFLPSILGPKRDIKVATCLREKAAPADSGAKPRRTMVRDALNMGRQVSYFLTSLGMSERASKRTSEREQIEQCGASKQVRGASD